MASLDPDHPNVALSRTSLANVLLGLDRPAEALPLAEQAWARQQQGDNPLDHRAQAAFVLARAQWEVATDAKDRERARSLADDALRLYRAAGDRRRTDVDEVQAWLVEHTKG